MDILYVSDYLNWLGIIKINLIYIRWYYFVLFVRYIFYLCILMACMFMYVHGLGYSKRI